MYMTGTDQFFILDYAHLTLQSFLTLFVKSTYVVLKLFSPDGIQLL